MHDNSQRTAKTLIVSSLAFAISGIWLITILKFSIVSIFNVPRTRLVNKINLSLPFGWQQTGEKSSHNPLCKDGEQTYQYGFPFAYGEAHYISDDVNCPVSILAENSPATIIDFLLAVLPLTITTIWLFCAVKDYVKISNHK